MLLVLDVKKESHLNLRRRCKALFRPYEIVTRVRKQNKITLLYLHYHAYRGEIRFRRIYERAIGASKTILCSPELSLEHTPFRRFESSELTKCLMQNLVLYLLRELSDSSQPLRLGFYDPMAENPSIPEALLQECASLTVVTNMPRFYERESERLLHTLGVPLRVGQDPSLLSACDVVICPEVITRHLPLSPDTLVFTTATPAVSLKGTILYEYFPPFPYRYNRLRTRLLEDTYLLSALYSLCGVKELGKLLPESAGDGHTLFTAERLVHRLGHNKARPVLLCAE